MAFSAGQESKEAFVPSRYIGVGSVNVLAINPNKAQLKELMGMELEDEPVYVGTQEVDGKKVEYARVDVLLHTVPESNDGIDIKTRMTFFLRNQYRFNRDKTKVQVIDEYARTAWVTIDDAKAKVIPTYSNGNKANITNNYRPCYQGEEELTNFFKTFLNIPNPMVYKNQQWVPAPNLNECQARFDHVPDMFKGSFKELQDALSLQPNNAVKVLFGVRTTDEGKQYQAFYTRMFLRNSAAAYDRLEADLKAAKEAGAYPSSEFQVCALKEYVIDSTPMEESRPIGDDPFGKPEDNPFFN